MKNIYIIGPQSTGKTTLVTALAAALNNSNPTLPQPIVIREVARTVLHDKHFTRTDIRTSPTRALQLQQHILAAQHAAECAISPPEWYISDRSGVDPIVYARLFVGIEAAAEMLTSTTWLDLEARMKDGVVFLCEAGVKWLVDDGTRLMPRDSEEWGSVEAGFREVLRERGIGFTVIGREAGVGERVEVVMKRWGCEGWMGGWGGI